MTIVTCRKCGAKNRVDVATAAIRQSVCGRCGTKLPVAGASGDGGATTFDGHPVEITDATFSQALAEAGDRPVLVDCWAAWCGPCRMLAPTIEALAAESNGRWIVGKLDTESNPRTAAQFRINSIPTMLIFKRGQLVDQLVGLQPKPAIEARLARATSG